VDPADAKSDEKGLLCTSSWSDAAEWVPHSPRTCSRMVTPWPSSTAVARRSGGWLPEDFAGTVVQGIGFDRDRLIEAGIDRAGALAAVTNGDNSNVLVARIARETYGVDRVVARIYDPRRAAIYQRLGLSTVATVTWTTDQVLRRLLPDPPDAEWTEPTGHAGVVERHVTKPWIGKPLRDLEEAIKVRVVGVGRLGAALVPSDATVAQEGDLLYIATATEAIGEIDRALRPDFVSSTAGAHS
jgi:trk system potassium uptake protein